MKMAMSVQKVSGKMKTRYFIVGPTEYGKANGDTLHAVCSTTSRRSFHDIYMNDWFVDEDSFGSLVEAVEFCKKRFGCKRPYVLI